jgi:hypothetical protein
VSRACRRGNVLVTQQVNRGAGLHEQQELRGLLLRREILDGLRLAVNPQTKILPAESAYERAARVADGDWHTDYIYVNADRGDCSLRQADAGLGSRCEKGKGA